MNDRHALLAARIFDTPLAIEPSRLVALLRSRAILDRFELDADLVVTSDGISSAADAQTLQRFAAGPTPAQRYAKDEAPPPYTVQDGVAVVDMMGELVHRSSWMQSASGLTSYDDLAARFTAAVNDPAVKAIVLRCDSPGGEVAGMFEMADLVFEARDKKPVIAVAEDMSASAAYVIGSAAEKFYTAQAGIVGSIGIISAHVDASERDKGKGVKITHFHAGARKLDGVKPLTDDSRAAIQGRVDALYDTMTSKIAVHRGISQGAVRETEAGVFVGAKAIDAGLADDVQPLGKLVAGLARRSSGVQVPATLRLGAVAVERTPGAVATLVRAADGTLDVEIVPASVSTPAVSLAKPAALAAPPKGKSKMPTENDSVVTIDPRDAELAELRAKNTVHEIAAAREKREKREAILEKHSARLSPSTMEAMKASLEPISDSAKVDDILSKLPDEVKPKAQGRAMTELPSAAASPAAAKIDDPQGEVIRRARELREKNAEAISRARAGAEPVRLSMAAAMKQVFKDDPALERAATAQREDEGLPEGAPPAPRQTTPAR